MIASPPPSPPPLSGGARGGGGDRIRAASLELGLALGGLFVGVFVLSSLRSLGLWPESSRGMGLVSGPVITGIAAVVYLQVALRAELPVVRADVPRATLGRTLVVVAIGIAAALLGSMALGAIVELLGAPVSEQASLLEVVAAWHDGSDRLSMIVLGMSAVVLAPIVEECLFRGLLFVRLRRHVSRGFAYGASALAFAAIHGNLAGLVVYVWLGLVFAMTVERTGRTTAAIVVHAGNNAFAFAALWLAPPG
jgi:membrane protease YdiL (CAAX protease family)